MTQHNREVQIEFWCLKMEKVLCEGEHRELLENCREYQKLSIDFSISGTEEFIYFYYA